MKCYLIKGGGYGYLIHILKSILLTSNEIFLELLTDLILIPIKKGNQSIDLFSQRMEKEWPKNILGVLIEESYIEEQPLL